MLLSIVLVAVTVAGAARAETSEEDEAALTLGVSAELARSGVDAALVDGYHEKNPFSRLERTEIPQGGLRKLVETGAIQAALVNDPNAIDALQAAGVLKSRTPIISTNYIVVVPQGAPVAVTNAASLLDLALALARRRSMLLLPRRESAIAERVARVVNADPRARELRLDYVDAAPAALLYEAQRRGVATVVQPLDWDRAGPWKNGFFRPLSIDLPGAFVEFVEFRGTRDDVAATSEKLGEFVSGSDGYGAMQSQPDIAASFTHFGPAVDAPKPARRVAMDHTFPMSLMFIWGLMTIAVAMIPLFFYMRERARFSSATRLLHAADGGRDGVWDWDVPRNRAYITPRAYKVLGLPVRESGVGMPIELFLSAVHPSYHDRVNDQLANALSRSTSGRFDIQFRSHSRKERNVWIRMRGLVICDDHGDVKRISGSVMDITRDKLSEARLRHEVLHDSLTSLPNRSYLYSRLERLLSSARESGQPFALFMIDLNRFKEINDTLGHGVGDELLKNVATRLLGAVEKEDMVARLGGDEFAVVLPASAAPAAFAKARKLTAALSGQPVVLFEHSIVIEASIGIAMFPDHGDSVDALMQRADIAMYTAKRNKIDCTFFSASANPNSLGQIEHETELRSAIENNALELHYQPKIDLKTGRVVSVEALVRWTHPQWGAVRPQLVAEIAEKSGLIHKLSAWVIDTAANQIAIWRRKGYELNMAVNLSVWNIQNPDIVGAVKKSLDTAQVSASWMEFEITETAMIVDPERAHKTLMLLSDLGITFSVDDFGTGFSSISYLKRLPVQTVKIDRSFVRDMVHDLADRSIVESTIDMAHNLGLIAVAEGVEEQAMLDLLLQMNCDEAQGYLFARALPAQELEHWLKTSPWGLVQPAPDKPATEIADDEGPHEPLLMEEDTVVSFPSAENTRSG